MNTEEQAEEKKEFPTDERGWTRINTAFVFVYKSALNTFFVKLRPISRASLAAFLAHAHSHSSTSHKKTTNPFYPPRNSNAIFRSET